MQITYSILTIILNDKGEQHFTVTEAVGEYIGRSGKATLDVVVASGARFQKL